MRADFHRLQRLVQENAHTQFRTLLAQALMDIRGDNEYGKFSITTSKLPKDLDTAESGHIEIEQHKIRRMRLHSCKTLLPVSGIDNSKTEVRHSLSDLKPHKKRIIDNENFSQHGPLSG